SRATLNEKFRNYWIGRSGRIEFPPRSPDLIPLGSLCRDIYATKFIKKNILLRTISWKQRILPACQQISK
ncbi:hypothetical protein WH47_06919, partial [Habropoda laboriosa]